MTTLTIKLKPAKEYPIKAGHPWIFSNAIQTECKAQPGDLVIVESSYGEKLGIGMINPLNSIRVRMLSRDPETPITMEYFANKLTWLENQKKPHLPKKTTGYRICHADADGLPGLVVDRYDDCIVFQVNTAGMDRIKDMVVEAIKKAFKPKTIVERSDIDNRSQEGLKNIPAHVHHGKVDGPVEFLENGVSFYADVMEGQKTGFFLDQRLARVRIGSLSKDRKVLNLFGYTGAFSVHAALGNAAQVTTVDSSKSALEMAKKNLKLNGFDPDDATKFKFLQADVLEEFRNKSFKPEYDLIVCDPPAFAKTEKNVEKALEAYQSLNQRCLWMLKEGGILVTSSCSGRVSAEEFRRILKMSCGRTGRDTRLLEFYEQPSDHTEKLSFPEGRYLKTAIIEVLRATEEKGA
jgi:23S rRNA (cytosine1962-C5)-methyltransferase